MKYNSCRHNLTNFVSLFIFLVLLPVSSSGSWNNWRGPLYNGSSQTTSSLPESFDKSTGVKWKVTLPGSSAAPDYFGRSSICSICINCEKRKIKGQGELVAMCFSASTGKLLWSKNAGSGYKPGKSDGFDYMLHDRSNYASPSPVVGRESVFFFFGNGDLVAYDFAGNEQWRRNLQQDYGDFCFQWTFSASPTFFSDRLYLPVLQRDEPVHGRGKVGAKSFLLCMSPKDGKTIWKHIRPSDAQKESLESFGTIIPYENELLVAGGDVLLTYWKRAMAMEYLEFWT